MFGRYSGFVHHFRRGRGPWGHMHGFGIGGRERGSVKYEILAVLAEGPRHGYEIMLAIEERRGYRPSPGSIYPALQMLEDEDYVRGREVDGKRVYEITEKGTELLRKRREERPDEDANEVPQIVTIFTRGMAAIHGGKDALKQIARSGDVELMKRAVETLETARRELYSLLAEEA